MLVKCTGYEYQPDGVVFFVIQVERATGGLFEMWEVRRRFSEFRKLHLELGDKRAFPSRLVLCRSCAWVTTRMRQLEDWLRGTVSNMLGWEPLAEFLLIPKNSPKSRLHQLLERFRNARLSPHLSTRDLFPLSRALKESNAKETEMPSIIHSLPSPEPLQYTTW